MIETKHLIEFVNDTVEITINLRNKLNLDDESHGFYKEYKAEIVARLRAYDKLKESIEKLIATMSSEVDK